MNLLIEYLARSGCSKKLFKSPCSVFQEREDGSKAVVTIDEKKEGYAVRRWKLFECNEEHALPPMDERIEKDLDKIKIIEEDYKNIPYICQPISTCDNSFQSAMPSYIYEYRIENYFNNYRHQLAKDAWLWESFMDTYKPQIDEEVKLIAGKLGFLDEVQKSIIKHEFPKLWKYWIMWKKYMLHKTIPGELVFISI